MIPGDISNIAETLPMLFPEQHDDVRKAEERFAKPDGHGMLFTNGTGTGKTYSGLGVIKRFALRGKKNTLVVAPSQGILMDWVKSATDLGIDISVLSGTQDKGRGTIATTYANLGANRHLADRDFDLVVTDESHKLSSDQNGTVTEALRTLRAITLHPDGLTERARMVLRDEFDRADALPKGSKEQQAAYIALQPKIDALVLKWKGKDRPKTLMMSATPFAYHFSLDYAEGYLFEHDREKDGYSYNSGGGREHFYMQHLGYRMRTNKLTRPDANVKSEVMERQLHEHLKRTGSLSGRALTVDKDYDRKFIVVDDAIGNRIDQALDFLQEADDGKFRPLHDVISKKFDYLTRMRLLEAIKAEHAVPYIKQSLDLGRKVVVFHDYNEGGGISPFELSIDPSAEVSVYQGGEHVMVKPAELYQEFLDRNPYVKDLDFASLPAPIYAITRAFPDALIYNGTVSNKERNEAKRLFNDDRSDRDIIVVQSAAGEAGISLHDTTGKHQRVIVNLGMPVRPTTSIQQEGRIYRVGQASDAIFRYMNTGTSWERWTFAGKIAERAGTAENLALGDQARTIRQSFIDAFADADTNEPHAGEGKGGKAIDIAVSHSVSEFEKAKTHYFAQGKNNKRRDQREGADYFATPEPIGLKMVEFAGIKPGEKILEPSAGHGAIARYFPEDTARTMVEPSSELASRAALTSPGARVVVDRFENLAVGANKFDAIIMNPPFGVGGKTAIEHLAKAASHLKNGGRIVALIPRGGAADKRFESFMDGDASKGVYIVGDVDLPSVTFERAGTSVRAHIVVLEKQTDAHIAQRLQQKNRDYTDVEKINDLFDRIENADMGERLEPETKDVDIPTEGGVTIDGVELNLNGESNGVVYADLKNKLGIDKFKAVMRAAEANEGKYLKGLKSIEFPNAAARQKFLDRLASPPVEEEQSSAAPSGMVFNTAETKHSKTGVDLFVASPERRVDRDAYDTMAAAAKKHGGWYSSFKGAGAIPGFQFKSAEARKSFIDEQAGKEPGLDQPGDVVKQERGAAAQDHVLERGHATGNEHYAGIGSDGEDAGRGSGTRTGIQFSSEFKAAILDPANDIVVHHNHPGGSSLSGKDVSMLGAPGLRAVWAHGHSGNSYRASLTPAAKSALPKEPMAAVDTIDQAAARAGRHIFGPMNAAVRGGAITIDQANMAHAHLVNTILRDAGIIDYQTNFDAGGVVGKTPGLNEAMKSAAKVARKGVLGAETAGNAGRPAALRHPGDVGTVFGRSAGDAGLSGQGSDDPKRQVDDWPEAGGEGIGLNAPFDLFTKPEGSFDSSIGDILHTRVLGKLGELNATEARVQFQDKFIRVKKAEDSVGPTPSTLSTYQAESLYYGRTGERLERLDTNQLDPLVDLMKSRGVAREELDKFLEARHAPERNNKIGAMYPASHDFNRAITDHAIVGGSGMSTNEALKVIRDIKAAGKLADYLAVAKKVDLMIYDTRRALFDGGLIDRETFDAWNNTFKYYVPLRGYAEGSEHEESLAKQGAGVDVRGKESKQAFGRKSRADSPIAYVMVQAQLAIVRVEKNKVGNTFLKFVRANPDPKRWTIDRPETTRTISKKTGLVTTVENGLSLQADNVFSTKVNGKDVRITLHGPDGLNLARALKNMGTANVHSLIRLAANVTHTMAKLSTAWNPEFIIPNFARDIGEAFINLQEQDQKKFVKNFVGHILPSIRGAMAAVEGITPAPGSKLEKYVDAFHRFDREGGRVRFFGLDDPDTVGVNIEAKLRRTEGGPLNRLKDAAAKVSDALEVINSGIENATRLAAFMAAEDAGMSAPDAAMLARNLTVDFNKKGELGSVIGALYMFANAGTQGAARMVKALSSRKVQYAVAALAAVGAAAALLAIAGGGDDETGKANYLKIQPWERDKNLIFMMPGGYYAKLPLPYGFAPFAVTGAQFTAVAMGKESVGKAFGSIMSSVIDAFNPLGQEDVWTTGITPSMLRPAVHIASNKTWTGRPLYPMEEPWNRGLPDASQSFRSDSSFSKETAKKLNEWTGGSPYKSGAVDIHPATIDHMLQTITGGVGHFGKGIVETLISGIRDHEWSPEKTPVLRRFVGRVGAQADQAMFYEAERAEKERQNAVAKAKKDLAGPDADQARKFLKENPAGPAKGAFESADKQIKDQRKQEGRVTNDPSLSSADRKRKIDDIERRIQEIQNRARKSISDRTPAAR